MKIGDWRERPLLWMGVFVAVVIVVTSIVDWGMGF